MASLWLIATMSGLAPALASEPAFALALHIPAREPLAIEWIAADAEAGVVETVRFRLKEGDDVEPDALAAYLVELGAYMNRFDTLLSRSVAVSESGDWLLVNHWTERAAMEQVNQGFETDPPENDPGYFGQWVDFGTMALDAYAIAPRADDVAFAKAPAGVVETVRLQLNANGEPAAFAAYLNDLAAYMARLDGLVGRTIAQAEDGAFVIVNHWTDRAAMDAINAGFETDPPENDPGYFGQWVDFQTMTLEAYDIVAP